jgi:hypothetical protein
MKIKRTLFLAYLTVFAILLLKTDALAGSITNFTKSIYYVPPTNFYMHDFSSDEFTGLFAYLGSGIQFESHNNYNDTILFMLEPACYINPNGDGKICSPLLPRTPADLRDDFNRYFHGETVSMTNLPDAKIGKTAGYTSVSASCQNLTTDSQLFYACWIQIQSNIVVTVTISSSNKKAFFAATNSLQTLKINKKEIMNIVKPSVF